MERHEAISAYELSESLITIFLREITGDDVNSLIFSGTPMVKLFDIANNIAKVVDYIRDGKRDADRLRLELLKLMPLVVELKEKASQKGFDPFAYNCDTIIRIIGNMEKWESQDSHQESTQDAVIPENMSTGGDGEKPKAEDNPLTKEDIIKSLEKIEPYKPLKDDEPIKYKEYYIRLTEGGVIDKKWPLDLFQYCVERADISKIVVKAKKRKDGKKQYARLFMNDVASKFSDSAKYRKKAAESFGLKNSNIGAVGGDAK